MTAQPARWLYHLVRDRPGAGEYRPASLATEGFVHCSYRDAVAESARLYFAGEQPVVLRIDPRLVGARVEEAITPRGPMPHVFGGIPEAAIVEVMGLEDVGYAPDYIL